jgi:hypothetical protein
MRPKGFRKNLVKPTANCRISKTISSSMNKHYRKKMRSARSPAFTENSLLCHSCFQYETYRIKNKSRSKPASHLGPTDNTQRIPSDESPESKDIATIVHEPRSYSPPMSAISNLTIDMVNNEISSAESEESEQCRRFRRVSNKETLNQIATLVMVSPVKDL